MTKNKTYTPDKSIAKAVESHITAAWADEQSTIPDSNVSIPSEAQVKNAKDWVETNEK